jgi:radical SAM protein with 4Fe4S-binding SPASM domain
MIDVKYFNFLKKIALANFNIFDNPFKLNFAITYWCNLRCKVCSIWKVKPKNELTLEEIETFTKKNNFFSWISLTGGEPFIRRDIVDIAKSFLENSKDLYLINIPTNGFLVDRIIKKTVEILELNVPKLIITVSLDGPKYIHDKTRGIESSWDRAVQTFKLLREISEKNKRLEAFVAFTLTPFTVGCFEDLYENVKKITPVLPSDFHVNIFHYSEHYYFNTGLRLGNYQKYLDNLLLEINKIIKMKGNSFKSLIKYVEEKYLKLARDFIKTNKTPLKCKAIDASIFMDCWGNVFPCTIWNVKLGNIKDFNFELRKILSTEKSRKIKEKIKRKMCPNCWTPCEANQMIMYNQPFIR